MGAVAADLVVAGCAARGVFAVAERGCVAVGCDLEEDGSFALFELVDESAGLEAIRGRDEADAAAVGEFFDVGELAWCGWVVCGHGLLLLAVLDGAVDMRRRSPVSRAFGAGSRQG
jgi:hypothetical protein